VNGHEFRLPTDDEVNAASEAANHLDEVFSTIPFGIPREPTPGPSGARLDGSTLLIYGFYQWCDLFSARQLLALGTFVKHIRETRNSLADQEHSPEWIEAIQAYLGIILDRTANYMSSRCVWEPVGSEIKQTFLRFAFAINWDYGEANPLSSADRYFNGAISNVDKTLHTLLSIGKDRVAPSVKNGWIPKIRSCGSALRLFFC
jgi:putative DNA methylase